VGKGEEGGGGGGLVTGHLCLFKVGRGGCVPCFMGVVMLGVFLVG